MNGYQWLGLLGGLLVAFGFVPQIVKVLRTRSSHDLSLVMLLVIFVGGLFYTTYAFLVGDPVFITINLLATGNTLLLLILKLIYR
ncbi:MtN3 and saliva related transmembrane protein [Geothermobacter ehrlichii]|uniref:MtN3 and saliva related transmembrane protein n=1 Tax=Geothermobacter ehrlichii TaxID=213224 RepID=A0A5D3WK64_9BACT|nr:PQ-loop repeat-containing protein [Geothermobacter ehrlichii]TYO98463.1 MtN3 and saliva related transmembrane protein [Geothermobacter ehrlichii]